MSNLRSILVLLAAVGVTGCVETIPLEERVGSFEVTLAPGTETGTAENPLPFPEAPFTVTVNVKALSNKGGDYAALNGDVTVYVTPGQALVEEGTQKARITLTNGVGSGTVRLQHVFGRTHICASDERRPGESTFAAGCSETMYFRMPTLRQLQLTDDGTTSPLVGSFVEVRSGDMIVTGILAEGFYVTDLSEAPASELPGNFGAMFVFSFSYPEDLIVGDRLESVTGTVQEFTGATQLTFPSWVRRNVPRSVEDLPEPVEITEEICDAAPTGPVAGMCGHSDDTLALESLEADVVVARNAYTPNLWKNCDYNRDGDVANWDPDCEENPPAEKAVHCAEIACKSECNLDPRCSELSGYLTYGQWAIAMNEGAGPKINVLTRQGYPELDPLESCEPVDPDDPDTDLRCSVTRKVDIAGNLRHSLPARPRWVIVARFGEDVTIHDDPVP